MNRDAFKYIFLLQSVQKYKWLCTYNHLKMSYTRTIFLMNQIIECIPAFMYIFCFSLCLMNINANVLVPNHEALLSRKSLWFSLPMPRWGESTVPCPLMMMCTSSFFQWGMFCNQATETDGDSSLILGVEWVIWHHVYTLWNVISVGTDNTSQGPWHPPKYGCTLCQY